MECIRLGGLYVGTCIYHYSSNMAMLEWQLFRIAAIVQYYVVQCQWYSSHNGYLSDSCLSSACTYSSVLAVIQVSWHSAACISNKKKGGKNEQAAIWGTQLRQQEQMPLDSDSRRNAGQGAQTHGTEDLIPHTNAHYLVEYRPAESLMRITPYERERGQAQPEAYQIRGFVCSTQQVAA